METSKVFATNSSRSENNINFLVPKAEKISNRLQELASEWDLERVYELNESVAQLSGTLLGKIINRSTKLPVLTTTFLAQETAPYWNPPMGLFKSLGYRMKSEIEKEKETLEKLLNDAESDFSYGVAVA